MTTAPAPVLALLLGAALPTPTPAPTPAATLTPTPTPLPARKGSGKAVELDPAADINAPRPGARRVRFATSVGTWMSVDVSPDGRTLVFDLLGDIYALPVEGGEARALTRGPAWDAQPRFSPDGRLVAFSSDRGGIENLWVMAADGSAPRAVTQEKEAYVRSPSWTPDGSYLLARKEDAKRAGIPPVELWMYHLHGGGGIKVTTSDEINNVAGPVASRDGRFVYFAARERRFSYTPDVSRGLFHVQRLDRATGERLPLTSGFGGGARPQLSPDGSALAYVSRRDADTVLVERDLGSGAERLLARGLSRDEQEGFTQMDVWPAYAYTPDGAAVVFASSGRIQRVERATRAVRDVPFRAEVEQWLAPRVAWQERVETGPVRARILRWPGQSPDGRRVAFEAFGRVWLQELEGGKANGAPARLTPDDPALPPREYAPVFSPDGASLAWVSWSDAEGGHVWRSAASPGARPTRLTARAGHYANPSWSAQGDRLLVVQGTGLEFRGRLPEEEEYFEIRWLEADAAEPRETSYVAAVKLAQTLKFHPQAFWSADGERVFFRDPVPPAKPTDDPRNDLVSVRLDGTDRKRHLRFPAVSDVVPSPDERWVAFTSRDNVYVTALPALQTKEPPEVSLKEGAVPVWRLSEEAGGYVAWADAGKTITWGLGPAFHRLPLAAAIAFVEEEKRKAVALEKKKVARGKGAKEGGDEEDDEDRLKVPRSERIELVLTRPRPRPEGSVVLRGGRVVTMGPAGVLEAADVVVTGNRIAAVAPAGKAAVPEGARELDARGTTIVPGLIDTHAHLHYSSFELFPETKWEYAANLAYGVTTVYDPSAPSLDVFAQAEMVEAGLLTGPRVYSSGDVLYGGQQEDVFAEVKSLADARRQVRRMQAYGARMIKVYQQPRRDQRIWFAEACRERRMLLTAEGAGELHTDLTFALDGYTAFEHSLPVELHGDVVELLAASGTHYTPTLLVSYGGPWGELWFWQERNPHGDPKLNRFTPHRLLDVLARRHPWITPEEYHFPTVARGAAQVARAGGSVSLGAHGQLQGLGVHWELWAHAGEGSAKGAMTPLEALRAATAGAADKIGFLPDLGSIEAGKLADLVVLERNPLEDIHHSTSARWVMKNGELYDAATLRQLWPVERELPPFFWRERDASAAAATTPSR